LLADQIGDWILKNRPDLTPEMLARHIIDRASKFITTDIKKQPGLGRAEIAKMSLLLHGLGAISGYDLVVEAQEMFRGVMEEPSILPHDIEMTTKRDGGLLSDPDGEGDSKGKK
jgi:hypothetical protein